MILGSTVWYLPGPGVLARSSENPPVFARLVIEKQAEEPLFGTFGPRSGGRVYELGEGVASPKSKKVMLTPYSYEPICAIQANLGVIIVESSLIIVEIEVFVSETRNGLADN